ncbi:MAG: phosphatidate cytidylyltransferase [Candidatus Sumerlaeaceae bacterium]
MQNSRARMALALICVVLTALRFETLAWVLPALGLVLAWLGCHELGHLMRLKGVAFSVPMAYVATTACYAAGLVACDIFPWLFLPLLAGVLVGAFVAHLARQSFEGTLVGVGAVLLPALYLGFSLACGLQILRVDRMYFLFVLVCVWAMDSAAFYFGCAYGRHKMAPRISPKKSWEGAAAALVASVVTAIVAKPILQLDLSWVSVVALGIMFAIVGQLGDMAESALKRDVGVKDSGATFAGHGGTLDRIDSLLFCFLAFYVWLLVTGHLQLGETHPMVMAG